MKSTSNITGFRKPYIKPQIEFTALDNEISLQLESSAPPSDPKGVAMTPSFVNQNPFKDQMA